MNKIKLKVYGDRLKKKTKRHLLAKHFNINAKSSRGSTDSGIFVSYFDILSETNSFKNLNQFPRVFLNLFEYSLFNSFNSLSVLSTVCLHSLARTLFLFFHPLYLRKYTIRLTAALRDISPY